LTALVTRVRPVQAGIDAKRFNRDGSIVPQAAHPRT